MGAPILSGALHLAPPALARAELEPDNRFVAAPSDEGPNPLPSDLPTLGFGETWARLSWTRRLLAVALTIAGPYALFHLTAWALIEYWIASYPPPFESRPFDASTWNAPGWRDVDVDPNGFHSIRQAMVDDLLESGRLDGLWKREVLDLLGPPDLEEPATDEPGFSWTYHLGLERSMFGIDGEHLTLDFSAGEFVVGAWLWND